jgi:hypothetical protein
MEIDFAPLRDAMPQAAATILSRIVGLLIACHP